MRDQQTNGQDAKRCPDCGALNPFGTPCQAGKKRQ